MRHNTTMFRCKYIGDNGALQGTEGWAWCEASQPGLTYLKWMYAVDNDPDNRTHLVVAPLELSIVRSWSKKKDAEYPQLGGDTERSMKYALGMLKDPYDLPAIRKLLGIPDFERTNEVSQENTMDFDALFATHDSADELINERQARDLQYAAQRAEAMAKIDSLLGAPLGDEDTDEVSTPAPVIQDSKTINLSDLFPEKPKGRPKKVLVPTQSPVKEVLANSSVLRDTTNTISLSELFGETDTKSDDSMVVSLAELFG